MNEEYLVFMDIDGTLIDKKQRVAPSTIETINKLQQKNVHFYIASGRMYHSATIIRDDINSEVGVVASNGSVYSTDGDLQAEHLGEKAIKEIIKVGEKLKLDIFFFGIKKIYYTNALPKNFQKSDQNRIASDNPNDFIHISSKLLNSKMAEDIVNGIVIDKSVLHGKLPKAKQELTGINNLTMSSSFADNIELIPAGVSKVYAVEKIQKFTGIPREHTISFGDGMNDVEMFEQSGISVAMGNASPEVKARANNETDTNLHDGIAKFLNEYFKI